MIAQKKFCTVIRHDPTLMSQLILKLNGTLTLIGLDSCLKRESEKIRRNIAFIETLRESGLKDHEIFENESAAN